jgi:hypothetical protein
VLEPVITLGTLRQEDHKFQTSLGYIVRPILKKQNKKPRTELNKIKKHQYQKPNN